MPSLGDPQLAAVAVAGIAAGLYLLGRGLVAYRQGSRLSDIGSSRISSLAAGEVRVSGTVVEAGLALVSPLQSVRCVYYRAQVDEGSREDTRSVMREERAVGFFLDDGSGRIRVFPRGARWGVDWRYEESDSWDSDVASGLRLRSGSALAPAAEDREAQIAALLTVRPAESESVLDDMTPAPARRRRRYREARLEPAETVTIVGTALPFQHLDDPDGADIGEPALAADDPEVAASIAEARAAGRLRATAAEAWGNAAIPGLRGVASSFWSPPDSPDPLPRAQRIAWAEEALAAAEVLGSAELVVRAAGILSDLYAEDGRFQQAMRVNLRRLDLVDGLPSREAQADLFHGAAIDILETAADPERAHDLLTRSYAITRETSDHQMMHTTAELLRAAFWLGRWDEIPPILEHHLAAFAREADVTCPEVRGGPAFGAMFLAHKGQPERARELADLLAAERQPPSRRRITAMLLSGYWLAAGKAGTLLDAIDTLQQSGDRWEERQLAQPRLEALAAVGDWKRLREFLPTARGLIDGDPLLGPMSDRAEARALAAEGRRDEAAAMLREAVDGFERFRFPFELARTQELLAEVVEPDEADGLRASALATFESLGAEPHATRVRAAIRGAARPDGALPAAPS